MHILDTVTRDWGEDRDARVVLRVKAAEAKAWKAAAKRKGLALSAWLRELANAAAAKVKR